MLFMSFVTIIALLAVFERISTGWFDVPNEVCSEVKCVSASNEANSTREMIMDLLIYFLVISVLSIFVGVSNLGMSLIGFLFFHSFLKIRHLAFEPQFFA